MEELWPTISKKTMLTIKKPCYIHTIIIMYSCAVGVAMGGHIKVFSHVMSEVSGSTPLEGYRHMIQHCVAVQYYCKWQ